MLFMSESGFPPFSPENSNRKDGYIVNCPDLIEPLFPHTHFSPTGMWSTRKFCMVNGVLRKGTNQNGTDQKTFYGINRIVNVSVSPGR